jgi:transcription antitermination factor NusG
MKTSEINNWIAINYYLNKERVLCQNLANQGFAHFIPKLNVIKNNKQSCINLFPGYGFVSVSENQITKLRYTKGIRNVLIRNADCCFISDKFILDLKEKCSTSLNIPIFITPVTGEIVEINKGIFQGNLAEVIRLKPNKRIQLMINMLSHNLSVDIDINHIKQIN